ncbi:IS1 family transposase, partial [Shigella sonnei]
MASVSISCPSCSATDGVGRKSERKGGNPHEPDSTARKTWQP